MSFAITAVFQISRMGVLTGHKKKSRTVSVPMSIPEIASTGGSQDEDEVLSQDNFDAEANEEIQSLIRSYVSEEGFKSRDELEQAFKSKSFCEAAYLDSKHNLVEKDLGNQILKKYMGPQGQYVMMWQKKDDKNHKYYPASFCNFIVKAWKSRKSLVEKCSEEEAIADIHTTMYNYILNGRQKFRPEIVPFVKVSLIINIKLLYLPIAEKWPCKLQEHFPNVINTFAGKYYKALTPEEYNERKQHILQEKGSCGIFEPFPEKQRPQGPEKELYEYICVSRVFTPELLAEKEEALFEKLTPGQASTMQKQMGTKWTEGQRDLRAANKEKKVDKVERSTQFVKSSKKKDASSKTGGKNEESRKRRSKKGDSSKGKKGDSSKKRELDDRKGEPSKKKAKESKDKPRK